ncbi:MAG: TraB/GumN family protein [Flavobacteriales bacterium]
MQKKEKPENKKAKSRIKKQNSGHSILKFRIAMLVLSIFALLINASAQQSENKLLWKIEKEGQKGASYILGTNALVTYTFLDNIKTFRKAFDRCDVLISEVKYSHESLSDISSLSVMKEKSLKQIFDSDEYVDVAAYFQIKTGLDFKKYHHIKPIAIYLMLNAINNREQGVVFNQNSTGRGINQYLQEEAKRKKKKYLALETVQSQIEMLFNSFSLERQAMLLLDLVRNENDNNKHNKELLNCYLQQNLNCLSEMLFFSNFSPEESRKLIRERNQEWIPQLVKVINMSNTFIAVGALHLPGEDGLLNLLLKQGFILTPMN